MCDNDEEVCLIYARNGRERACPDRSSRARYHRADERARAPDRGRTGLPVRGVRGRPRRPVHGARPPAPLFRRTTPGAAGPRAPGGVLPLVGVRGLPHVPGLGPPRGRRRPPGCGEPVHTARGAVREPARAAPRWCAVRPTGRNRTSASTIDPAGLGRPAPVGRQRSRPESCRRSGGRGSRECGRGSRGCGRVGQRVQWPGGQCRGSPRGTGPRRPSPGRSRRSRSIRRPRRRLVGGSRRRGPVRRRRGCVHRGLGTRTRPCLVAHSPPSTRL